MLFYLFFLSFHFSEVVTKEESVSVLQSKFEHVGLRVIEEDLGKVKHVISYPVLPWLVIPCDFSCDRLHFATPVSAGDTIILKRCGIPMGAMTSS